MKNLPTKKLTVFAIFFILMSCSVEENQFIDPSPDSAPVTSQDNAVFEIIKGSRVNFQNDMLFFESVEDYVHLVERTSRDEKEHFVQLLAANSGFPSLLRKDRANLTKKEIEIVDNNHFIASILNHNGMVRIGSWIIKVSLSNERVFVIPLENAIGLQNLDKKIETHPLASIYSIHDPIVDLLGSSAAAAACFEYNAIEKKDDDFYYHPASNLVRQDNKVVYQAVGIYFSLQSKTKTQQRGWTGIWYALPAEDQHIEYIVDWKRPCGDSGYESGTLYDNGSDNELNYRPYESVHPLTSYDFSARFYGFEFESRVYWIKYPITTGGVGSPGGEQAPGGQIP